MDWFSHGFAGVLVASSGFEKHYGPWCIPICVAASFIPDLDNLAILLGRPRYYRVHRQFSHSVPVALVLALAAAFAFSFFFPGIPLWALSLMCIFSVGFHLFLDWCTTFGTALLLPFSSRRFSLDLVGNNDYFLAGWMGIAGVAALVFRGIAQPAAIVGFAVVAVYLLVRFSIRGTLLSIERMVRGGNVWVFPSMTSALSWRIFSRDRRGYELREVSLVRGRVKRARWFPFPTRHRKWVRRAASLREARLVISRARLPYARVVETVGGEVVLWQDLLFFWRREWGFFTAYAQFSKDGTLISHGFGIPRIIRTYRH